jgi:ABC-type uncharacterized transport system ATPase subunit
VAALSDNAAPEEPAISVSGLSKRFPGVIANHDISLDFRFGEVHVLLGENGAGKSTLVGILSGLLKPNQGTIFVHGERVNIRSPRSAIKRGIGCVHPLSTLVPTMTVLDNLMLGQRWYRPLPRRAALARLDELSRLMGIEIDPRARIDSLSPGEQLRVEIVKALWRGQRILILDEPTVRLTPQGMKDLAAVIARLRAEGFAIIVVTQNLHDVIAFADRVSILKEGRLAGRIGTVTFRSVTPEQVTAMIVERLFGPADEHSQRLAEEFEGKANLRRPKVADEARGTVLDITDVATAAKGREIALAGTSLNVRAGEIVGIAGVDGNGQRQFAEVLAGQRPIARGSIVFSGRDISSLPVKGRQKLGLHYLTCDRLGEGAVASFPIALNLVLKRIGERPFWRFGLMRKRRIREHARDLMDRYEIAAPSPKIPIARLSAGNIQKALLARELDGEPALVIYNKPTDGLNSADASLVRQRIRDAADRGVAAILISTDRNELRALCDRIAVMDRGRVAGIVDNAADDTEHKAGDLMVAGAEP